MLRITPAKALGLLLLGSMLLGGCGMQVSSASKKAEAISPEELLAREAARQKEENPKNVRPPVIKENYTRYNFCRVGAGGGFIAFDGYIATFTPGLCNVVDYKFTKTEAGGKTTFARSVSSRLYQNLKFVLDLRNPTAANQEAQPQLFMDPLSPLVAPLSPLVGIPAHNPNVNTGNVQPGDLAYFEFFIDLVDQADKKRVFEAIASLAQSVLSPTKTLFSFVEWNRKEPLPTPDPSQASPFRQLKILQSCAQVQAAWNTPVPPPHNPNRPPRPPHSNFHVFGLNDGLMDNTSSGHAAEMRINPDTSIPELCGDPGGWVP